jgi:hypothetical protein
MTKTHELIALKHGALKAPAWSRSMTAFSWTQALNAKLDARRAFGSTPFTRIKSLVGLARRGDYVSPTCTASECQEAAYRESAARSGVNGRSRKPARRS